MSELGDTYPNSQESTPSAIPGIPFSVPGAHHQIPPQNDNRPLEFLAINIS